MTKSWAAAGPVRAAVRRRWLMGLIAALALAGCGSGGAGDFIWGRAPSFLPDGSAIIYAQNLSTPSDTISTVVTNLDAGLIWRVAANGSSPKQLTPDGRGPDFFPAVSPDGTLIAFVSGENGQFDVWVMNLDGTNRRRLTFDLASDTTPAWTTDGRILFVSERSGNADLWSVRADGSGLTQLTTSPSDEASPEVDPVTGRIAFGSNRDRGNFDIWVMAPDGGDLRHLTTKADSGSRVADGGPTWSPDGTKIAFERWDGNWDIYVMNADGTGLRRLTDDRDHDGDPTFRPDGAQIAFTSARTGWWQVWAMNADGSDQHQLTGRAQ